MGKVLTPGVMWWEEGHREEHRGNNTLKWNQQTDMIDQLNSAAEKSTGLSSAL